MSTKNNFHFLITSPEHGQRLDKWLVHKEELHDFIGTRSFAQNLIDSGAIFVNKKTTKGSYMLKINDVVDVVIPQTPQKSELIPYNFALDIVYEDNDLIVVNKPAGLVVHPAAGHEQDTLVNALLAHTSQLSMKNEQRPGIVHRIDKETSGLLVVAKNDLTHEHLAQQFKNKSTHRIYDAVAESKKKASVPMTGSVSSYLARHPTDRKRYASLKKEGKIIRSFIGDLSVGKWAVTHYQCLETAAGIGFAQSGFAQSGVTQPLKALGALHLLRLQLQTGRTHQIRVHLSELGFPLVGDVMYGFSVQKMNALNIDRFYLHAAELGFTHPRTKKDLLFKRSWPEKDKEKIFSWGFNFYQQGTSRHDE